MGFGACMLRDVNPAELKKARTKFAQAGLTKNSRIVEVGPFASPLAPKADGWDTTVVDVFDTEYVMDRARNSPKVGLRRKAVNVEPVDLVWDGQHMADALLEMHPEGYDALLASHVVEHIPDLIAWFGEIEKIAAPGFTLRLIVPDTRLERDFFMPLTDTAAVVQAHREQRKIHSPETLLRIGLNSVQLNGEGGWQDGVKGTFAQDPKRIDAIWRHYLGYAGNYENGTQEYQDGHSNYWTPNSFELMILEMNHLGLTGFMVDEIDPHAEGKMEFLVRMSVRPHGLSAKELAAKRIELMIATRREQAEALKVIAKETPSFESGQAEIVGESRVGGVLKARKLDFFPNPHSYSHRWYRNGVEIPDETEWEYSVRPGDVGAVITLKVTACRNGYHDYAVMSPPKTVTAE